MNNTFFINISFLGLLFISKLSSGFLNMSPFIATIIIGAYFINNKYHLLLMIIITQFVSDFSFGLHISNIFLYISYLCIVFILYYLNLRYSLINSVKYAIYTNIIFYCISNLGHYISYSETYTLTSLINNYFIGISFGVNLLFSTIFFIIIYHTLLAVNKKQLVKN